MATAHLARPTGQLQRPHQPAGKAAPHAARRTPPQSAAIHGHPGPSWRSPGRLAASPSARVPPPIPARLSPRRLASPHLPWPTGQFPSPARTHATRRGHRTPACLALAVSAGRSAAPAYRCSGAAWPAILRANVLWSESDSWGTPTGPPRPGDRLARPTGQRPLDAHEGPDGLLALIAARAKSTRCRFHIRPASVSRRSRMANWRMKLVEEKEGGTLAHGRESHPRGPLQPPGAAGPVSGGGV